ncbi:MAG: di-trans,poly-cis-decaprenylcistransferase [Proteobacteria bacterium]|nr:di-trans,poly-cis-decaprenylcistransferase [Pseudomonadota bacterium]MCP4921483.1 di-trans,poly-cis-decaprenylcistransferase [Pseudomonadota bacterium]
MDGNGRWAQSRGLPRIKGHHEGAESVRDIVTACRELGVEALTLYSFSTENWKRPEDEVAGLMKLLKNYLVAERSTLLDNDIRLRGIGQINRLPLFVRKPLQALMRETDTGKAKMTLNLALSYGSRAELVDVTRELARKVAAGQLDLSQVDEAAIDSHLYTAGLPDPDLLIRTSGELRISNFMLWQLAYAEIYVTDTYWPEFRKAQLIEAFENYAARERRFGKTGAQVLGSKGKG